MNYADPFFGHMFLIVVDVYSKWTQISLMKTSTALTTIEKMKGIFAIHGQPVLVVSDNGPCFSTQEFKTFMKVNGIQHFRYFPSPILKWAGAVQCVHI